MEFGNKNCNNCKIARLQNGTWQDFKTAKWNNMGHLIGTEIKYFYLLLSPFY